MDLLAYGLYIENQLNGNNMSLTSYMLQFGDVLFASNFLFRPRTQNTDFYFEDEGGEKSIATREWVSGNLPSLQQVTDVGNTTENNIYINLEGYEAIVSPSNISFTGGSKYSDLSTDGLAFGDTTGGTFQTTLLTKERTQNTDFCLEDEGGTKSIATREWVNANNYRKWLVKDTTPTTAVTGTTSRTQIGSSILMSANTFSAEDLIALDAFAVEKGAGIGTCQIQIWHNTSDTLTGATAIAVFSMANANVSAKMVRTFEISEGLLKCRINGTTNTISDIAALSFAPLSIPFDETIDNYFFTTVQLGNASDSVTRTQLLISK